MQHLDLTLLFMQVHGTLLQLAAVLRANFVHHQDSMWPDDLAQQLYTRLPLLLSSQCPAAMKAELLTVSAGLLAHPQADATRQGHLHAVAGQIAAACRALLAAGSLAPAAEPQAESSRPDAGADSADQGQAAAATDPAESLLLKQAALLLLSERLRAALQPGEGCLGWPDRVDVTLVLQHAGYEVRCAGLKALLRCQQGKCRGLQHA